MTEWRDVYLLKKVTKANGSGNPFNKSAFYAVIAKKIFCRVNDLGLQKQQLLFGGDSLYQDAKTVIVSGHPERPAKIAFTDEYDPKTQKGIVYDVRMPRIHSNTTAYYIYNTQSKVG